MLKKQEMTDYFKLYGHDKVMFIGLDISKNFHVFTAVNGYGEILSEPMPMDIYTKGFELITSIIDELKQRDDIKVIVFGCEPSGHYYLNIMSKLKAHYPDAICKLVNPAATKANRDQMMEVNKTDDIDSLAIVDLLIRGSSYNFTIADPLYKGIKEYVRLLDSLIKEKTKYQNKIHAYMDEIYPGLENKAGNFTNCVYGMNFLSILPDPNELKKMNGSDIVNLYASHNYSIYNAYAKKISDAASELLLIDDSSLHIKVDFLKILHKQFTQVISNIEDIENKLESLVKQLNYSENITKIKGIGTKSFARIIAYMGNPNRFEKHEQVASFVGIVPSKAQSGKTNIEKGISRKGHKKLRSTLVQCAQVAISNESYFTAYYNRLIIDGRKDPKVAITATAHKMIKIIMHLIQTGEEFNPPTVENKAMLKTKIKRLTKKELESLAKNKKSVSLTQDIRNIYLTRV